MKPSKVTWKQWKEPKVSWKGNLQGMAIIKLVEVLRLFKRSPHTHTPRLRVCLFGVVFLLQENHGMSGLTWLAWAPQEHQHMASHSFSWWWTRMWWQGSRFVLCAAPWRWRWRYRHHPNRLQSLSHCICNILGSKTYCEEQSTHVFNVFIGSQCVTWEPLTQDFICRISKKCSHAEIFGHDLIAYRTPERKKKH